MNISQWPLQERPREKLLQMGAENLSDAELLAILLRHGVKGKSALDIARELYKEYDGLNGLFSLDYKNFSKIHGLGLAKFAQLKASQELSRRYLQENLKRQGKITNIEDVKEYVMSQLKGCDQEIFAVLFLDNRHRIICFEKVFYGTIHGASIYPREIVKRALYHNAAAVIFAHNHPSGIAEPSEADRSITERLIDALSLVEVRVLDHVIVAGNDICSFIEQQLI